MFKQLTPTERLEKYTKLHPNYDHSSTDLTVNGKHLISVVCLVHGEFTTTAARHLHQVHTCPECLAKLKQNRLNIAYTKRRNQLLAWMEQTSLLTELFDNLVLTVSCKQHGLLFTIKDMEQLPSNPACQQCIDQTSVNYINKLIKSANLLKPNTLPLRTSTGYRIRYRPTTSIDQIECTCAEHGMFTGSFKQLQLNQTCPVCDNLN